MPDFYKFWIPDYWHSLDTAMQPSLAVEIVATFVYVLSLAVVLAAFVFILVARDNTKIREWYIPLAVLSLVGAATPPLVLAFSYPFLYVVCPIIAIYGLRRLVQRLINRGTSE